MTVAATTGDFVWYELMTPDPDAAAAFYGAVIGWRFERLPVAATGGQDYRLLARDDGGHTGGVLGLTPAMRDGGARPGWLPYFHVADVDAALAAIAAQGGSALMPATDLPAGRIAMAVDPQGVPIYVIDPNPPADDGEFVSDVFSPDAGQRVGWNELASPALEATKAFYAAQFGFEFNETMPMGEAGEYCFIDRGGRRLGGVLQRQDDGEPPAWRLYFRVPSIAAARATIEGANGAVVVAPMEVPGGEWILVARDPQGASFGLLGGR